MSCSRQCEVTELINEGQQKANYIFLGLQVGVSQSDTGFGGEYPGRQKGSRTFRMRKCWLLLSPNFSRKGKDFFFVGGNLENFL